MGYPDWVPDEGSDNEEPTDQWSGFDLNQWLEETEPVTEFNWGGNAVSESDDVLATEGTETEEGFGQESAAEDNPGLLPESLLPGDEDIPDRGALVDSSFVPKSTFVPAVVVALLLILAIPALAVSVPWAELVPVEPDSSDDLTSGDAATATPTATVAAGSAGGSTVGTEVMEDEPTTETSRPKPAGGGTATAAATATSEPVNEESVMERTSTAASTDNAAGRDTPGSFSTNAVTAPIGPTDTAKPADEDDTANTNDETTTDTATPTDEDDTATRTATAEPTDTATAEPTDTATAEPTDTATAEPTDTATAEPTDTATAEPTDAETATDTATPTPTAEPTATPTPSPTPTDGILDPITDILQ